MLSRLPLRYYSKVAMLSHAAMLTLAFGQTSAQILEVRSAPGFLVAQERTSVVVEADEPPVFAKRFNMNFKEESSMRRTSFPFTVDTKHNDGSFHYDFDNRREVWVHGKGQGDNWCQCAGTNTDDECHLKSVPSKDQPGGGWVLLYRLRAARAELVAPLQRNTRAEAAEGGHSNLHCVGGRATRRYLLHGVR
eukprot:TRINITY_DN5272_c0_g1_i2.p1 TRINITY_DN5272_c0_g1~~TRINITY_DN5272_c0_g1_i2.p1  ORF type:complete len:192 (+),score=27.67 TRINITY_DN5272_c0_g1_i2:30-605(+)